MPDNITRIEFEIMGNGRFRWRLWSGDRLTHDEMSLPDTVAGIMLVTRELCTESFSKGSIHAKEETGQRPGPR